MERIFDNMWTFVTTLHFLNRCLLGASTVMDLGTIHTIVPHITKREMAVLSNSNLSKCIQTWAFQRERTCSWPCWGSGSGLQTAIPVPPRPGPPRHWRPSAYLLWHPLSLETPSVTSQKKTACQFMDSFFFLAVLRGFWNLSSPTRGWTQVRGSDNMDGDLTAGLPRNSPQGLF